MRSGSLPRQDHIVGFARPGWNIREFDRSGLIAGATAKNAFSASRAIIAGPRLVLS
jgi:hypothetical protein